MPKYHITIGSLWWFLCKKWKSSVTFVFMYIHTKNFVKDWTTIYVKLFSVFLQHKEYFTLFCNGECLFLHFSIKESILYSLTFEQYKVCLILDFVCTVLQFFIWDWGFLPVPPQLLCASVKDPSTIDWKKKKSYKLWIYYIRYIDIKRAG